MISFFTRLAKAFVTREPVFKLTDFKESALKGWNHGNYLPIYKFHQPYSNFLLKEIFY
jgi:hypothetical protein